jgi:hypothetical protein
MGDIKSATIFLGVVLIIVIYTHIYYQRRPDREHQKKFKDLCGDESRKVINFNRYINRNIE